MSCLKERITAGESIDGVLLKSPSHQTVELLAAGGTECVMIDTEHAPFGPSQLDTVIAMARALGVDTLVRVPAARPEPIQQALDMGASGVIVPHVDRATVAADAVRWSHYGDGGRGFSGSTRSAGWGTRSLTDVLAAARRTTVVVAQIEDVAALGELDTIVTTDGLDACFVGAADLAVGMGATSTTDPDVVDSCTQIIEQTRAASRAVVAYANDADDAARWRAAGVTLVFTGSDQSRIRTPPTIAPAREVTS